MSDFAEGYRAAVILMDDRIDDYQSQIDKLRDEIERLHAALREIVTTDPPQSSNDWFQEWKTLAFRLKSIARRALEGK